MIIKLLLVLKIIVPVATVGYTILLATVCLITIKDLPDVGVSFGDKIFHFLAYGLLTMLWFGTFFLNFNFKEKQAILYALILAVIFGILIEVLQDTMTVSRALDVYDMVANTIGALLASLLLMVKNKILR
ncbi:VanZ family protein [Tamlana sp. 2_MG-2023]|uniref:VanZ family protein n=1 Tax=unclassified Tamlana TaxID=2614803 RepID=UPI0026E4865E|nr:MULTISPECIES: VanZ family protein [unclassified Tamlana]MDO6761036.1 VanZ family protein [Tamlana sp. 2_MG-2023]MDO6791631.1 VanZ family protein [Tamlana sp. 1_MG-2023]